LTALVLREHRGAETWCHHDDATSGTTRPSGGGGPDRDARRLGPRRRV